MRKYKLFLPIVLTLSICFISVPSTQNTVQTFSSLEPYAIGPGLDNLSLGDAYATYQWGLKNDGEFRLIELREKFQSINPAYEGASHESGEVGLPKIEGPGAYESTTTNAVPGIDINILPAWDLYNAAENKRPVTVAIIDTGIDYRHAELQNAMWINPGEIPGDGIDNDGNGYIDDVYGWDFYYNTPWTFWGYEDSHGTHAAGTIAASKGSFGITGITDNNYIKIMSLKALGGKYGSGSTQDVIKAIHYAEANGASICNLSFGTTVYDEALEKTIAESNMLFIVAAGNGNRLGIGYNIDVSPVFPASFQSDNIISVANLLFDGNLSNSSNYGAASVDIAAPGSYVLSTIPGDQYAFMTGTSMSAPMVTGVAAMLYSYRTDISLSDVKNILLESARKSDALEGKLVSGGMLDAHAALTHQ